MSRNGRRIVEACANSVRPHTIIASSRVTAATLEARKLMYRVISLPVLFLSFALPARADTFGQASRAYGAFKCAIYAHIAVGHDSVKIVEPTEEMRLFELGVEEARKHASSLLTGKYDPQQDVLDGFRWSLTGPSVDFIAGRLAEYAQSEVVEEMPKKPISLEWTPEAREKARENYLKGNCRALR